MQHTITNSAWTQISTPGQNVTVWFDEQSDGAKKLADVRVIASLTTPVLADITRAKRIYRPSSNNDTLALSPSPSALSFWARCANVGDEAILQVETSGYGINQTIDTHVQDQHTQQVNIYFNKELSNFVLSGIQIVGTYILNVVAGHSAVSGNYVCIQQKDEVNNVSRIFQSRIISVGATTFEVSRPIDFAFDPTKVLCSKITRTNMAGEVGTILAPVKYKIKPLSGKFHLYQIHFVMFSPSGTFDDGTFGPIAKLAHGLTFVRVNGQVFDLINVRSNGEILGYGEGGNGYSLKPPSGTGSGFTQTISFINGNGSVPEIDANNGGSIEIWIPDSLAAWPVGGELEVKIEGHEVKE